MSSLIWIGLSTAVFAAALVYDVAAARYTAAVSARDAHAAARWACLCCLMGLLGIGAILRESLWLAGPELAGVYAGSLIGVRWARSR